MYRASKALSTLRISKYCKSATGLAEFSVLEHDFNPCLKLKFVYFKREVCMNKASLYVAKCHLLKIIC